MKTSVLKRILFLIVLGGLGLAVHYMSKISAVKHVARNILDHFKHDMLPVEDLSAPGVCRIPTLDPWDASIMHFFQPLNQLVCDQPWQYPLTQLNGSCLFVNQSARLQAFSTVAKCFFRYIVRPDGRDDICEFSEAVQLALSEQMQCINLAANENFIQVICEDTNRREVYVNYHAYIHVHSPIIQSKPKKSDSPTHQLSINILGLDSISRSNVLRKLPQTYKYLTEELGAIVFKGYNKVADNTFPNIIPLLVGKSYDELTWIFGKYFAPFSYLDKYDFIWKKAKGFVTILAEDEPEIATFNTGRKGFSSQPTDFYMRPYWLSFWRSTLFNRSNEYCLGNMPRHVLLLDWVRQLFELCRRESRAYFSYVFYTELVHSQPNFLGYLDNDLLSYVHSLDINSTVFISFGDHGHRNGKFRRTFVGKMEDRLPWLSIVLPPWFKLRHPQVHRNLVQNSDQLVTLFDVHETLKDLFLFDSSSAFQPHDLPSATHGNGRGISLFQKIPEDRSCKSAGIESHYCSCVTRTPTNTSVEAVQVASVAIVAFINKFTEPFRKLCAKLKLKKVVDAALLQANSKVLAFKSASWFGVPRYEDSLTQSPFKDYLITVQTWPGDAMFEATVRYHDAKKKHEVSPEMSRVNLYGHQAACVKDKPDLKKYCFCQQ